MSPRKPNETQIPGLEHGTCKATLYPSELKLESAEKCILAPWVSRVQMQFPSLRPSSDTKRETECSILAKTVYLGRRNWKDLRGQLLVSATFNTPPPIYYIGEGTQYAVG